MRLVDDNTLAVLTIWAEARSESEVGKICVGEVIRNRTLRRYHSDGTLANTVFRKLQFSCFNHDNPWRHAIFSLDTNSPAVQECIKAWELARAGSDIAKGAVLYHADYIDKPKWASAPSVRLVKTVGRHYFYTDEE